MKKAMLVVLFVLSLLISSAGVAQANGCPAYLVDVQTNYGDMYQTCMEFCDYGGYVEFYSYDFGYMEGSLGNLGTDRKTIMLWGDGDYGIPAAFIFKFRGGPNYGLLSGEGVCPYCDGTIFQFEGKASSSCYIDTLD